jgi:hypothetical protein
LIRQNRNLDSDFILNHINFERETFALIAANHEILKMCDTCRDNAAGFRKDRRILIGCLQTRAGIIAESVENDASGNHSGPAPCFSRCNH